MNRITVFFFLSVLSSPVMLTPELQARGGRGGGFHEGGRNQVHMNRSPSMSRSAPRNAERPRNIENRDFQRRDVPQPVDRDRNFDNRDFERKNSAHPIDVEQNRQADWNQHIDRDRNTEVNRNFDRNVNVGNTVNINNRKNWFGEDYWHAHPNRWYRNTTGVNWWGAAAWGTMVGWLPWAWSSPVYYKYDETREPSSYDFTEDLVESAPNVNVETVQWLPLGVFSLSKGTDGNGNDSYLQLAVSKEGVISGTYINTTTSLSQSIEGMVDEKSQRAAWKVIDNPEMPIMQTGAYNLTQDQTDIVVYYPEGRTAKWEMKRIEQPSP